MVSYGTGDAVRGPARQIHEGTPYPVKALFALGLNYRILPDDQYFKSAMEKLDFFVDADLFYD